MDKQPTQFTWQGASTAQMVSAFHRDGYLMLHDFASHDECDALMQQADKLIDDFDAAKHKIVFSASGQSHAASDYFMKSASNISFFLEQGAVDNDGNLIKDKAKAINKIGHALHDLDPHYRQFSRKAELADLAQAIGFENPLLLQSMVICKQPLIGGEVNPHQDSTFLYTEPESCVGFWLALEDATIENGCMWASEGGHNGPLLSRFVRGQDGMEMVENEAGIMPECDVPLIAPKGTLILLHGRLPHLSPANHSKRSRYAYALHVIDGTADYAADNWLQRPDDFALSGFA